MTKYTKFNAIVLAALAVTAPDRVAASSQANMNAALVASADPSNPLSFNYAGPPPAWSAGTTYQRELKEPSGDVFDLANQSALKIHALYTNSVAKASIYSFVRMGPEKREYDETVSSYGSLGVSTRDNISFLGIGAGKTATLYLGNYADIKTQFDAYAIAAGDNPIAQTFTSTQFSFTSKAVIYESINDYLSERARPKYSHQFHACDGTRLCDDTSLLRGGNRQLASFFEVDSDDVLVLTNDLYLASFLSATKAAGTYDWVDARYHTDFGNSGYTFLKMLTPGTGYASESGETYLTELPAAVPEPQSWAMLILGFGVVGGALRRRRDARAIAA
jgi:hypothetical protein